MRTTLRALLVLGRISNLPTVWSNCLAGWYLGSAQHPAGPGRLVALCAGVSLLYIAGMYLNDAFDVEFDTQHRPERPIPAGLISRNTVGGLGMAFTASGLAVLLALVPAGPAWSYVFGLAALIWIYDAWHKGVTFSPVLMAGCRVLIYPIAGVAALASTKDGASLPAGLWTGAVAVGFWVLTLSLLARTESGGTGLRWNRFALLAAPLAFWGWTAAHLPVLPAFLLLGWIALSLLRLHRTGKIGAAVGDLLAGIPLVNLLGVAAAASTAGSSHHLALAGYLPFVACMALALILRRSIPPT